MLLFKITQSSAIVKQIHTRPLQSQTMSSSRQIDKVPFSQSG
jgi:hypothetical protein